MTMMMTTNFSETKKQGGNKSFKIWGWGRNKGFWPEYLPINLLHHFVRTLEFQQTTMMELSEE